MTRLAEGDAFFADLRAAAEQEGKVLRYVGVIDPKTQTVKCSLEKCVRALPARAAELVGLKPTLRCVPLPPQVRRLAPVRDVALGLGQHHLVHDGALPRAAAHHPGRRRRRRRHGHGRLGRLPARVGAACLSARAPVGGRSACSNTFAVD